LQLLFSARVRVRLGARAAPGESVGGRSLRLRGFGGVRAAYLRKISKTYMQICELYNILVTYKAKK